MIFQEEEENEEIEQRRKKRIEQWIVFPNEFTCLTHVLNRTKGNEIDGKTTKTIEKQRKRQKKGKKEKEGNKLSQDKYAGIKEENCSFLSLPSLLSLRKEEKGEKKEGEKRDKKDKRKGNRMRRK